MNFFYLMGFLVSKLLKVCFFHWLVYIPEYQVFVWQTSGQQKHSCRKSSMVQQRCAMIPSQLHELPQLQSALAMSGKRCEKNITMMISECNTEVSARLKDTNIKSDTREWFLDGWPQCHDATRRIEETAHLCWSLKNLFSAQIIKDVTSLTGLPFDYSWLRIQRVEWLAGAHVVAKFWRVIGWPSETLNATCRTNLRLEFLRQSKMNQMNLFVVCPFVPSLTSLKPRTHHLWIALEGCSLPCGGGQQHRSRIILVEAPCALRGWWMLQVVLEGYCKHKQNGTCVGEVECL